jgi:hypothetical protein
MAVSFGIELRDSFVDGAVEGIRAGEGLVGEVMSLPERISAATRP